MRTLFLLFFSLILLLGYACQDDGKYRGEWTINPNGDSELALLMRDMYDDAMDMKLRLEQGRKPKVYSFYDDMYTAEATEPEKVARDDYTVFSKAYQMSLEGIQRARIGDMHSAYKGMVQSCMNCHNAMCPGPIDKIEHLLLD